MRLLVTALDVILSVSGATATIMALGVRGKFSFGAIDLTVNNPWRPALVAVAVLLVRLVIARGYRFLPSIPRELSERLEAERIRFATPEKMPNRARVYAIVAVAASLIWITPHIVKIRYVTDPFDPVFSAWRLARFTHQLLNDPAHLFDGNIFYPARYTLTYSDPSFLEAVVAVPFIAAGVDPIVVANAIFLSSFPLCAVAFFYAAWRLTSDPQAACVAGILGGLTTFKIEHYSHFELQFLCFAPVALVMLLRMLAAPSRRTGAWFGAAMTAQWLACMYLGMMLVVFLAPVAIFAGVAWRTPFRRGFAAACATAAIIVVAGGSLTAIPFMRSQADRGERPLDLVAYYSATPGSYWDRTPKLATYRNIGSEVGNLPERELFPGAMPLALGAIGVAPPVSLITAGLAAATAVAFDSSLGTNGLVYPQLYRYLVPFRGMRVPARFAALVGTGLILLSAFGARRILDLVRSRGNRTAVFVLLAAAALIDMRIWLPLQPYPSTIPSIYASVTPDMVLAEVPMRDRNIAYMYFSTSHWARLVNGYSGYMPPSYGVLEEEMERFPAQDVMQRLRDLGTTHITVNCRFMGQPRCAALLETLGDMREVELVSGGIWQGAPVRLYKLLN